MDIVETQPINPLLKDPTDNHNSTDPSNLDGAKLHPLFAAAYLRRGEEINFTAITLEASPSFDPNDIFGLNNITLDVPANAPLTADPLQAFINQYSLESIPSDRDPLTGSPLNSPLNTVPDDLILSGSADGEETLLDSLSWQFLPLQMEIYSVPGPDKLDSRYYTANNPHDNEYLAFVNELIENKDEHAAIAIWALGNSAIKTISFDFYKGNLFGTPEDPEMRRVYEITEYPARLTTEALFALATAELSVAVKALKHSSVGRPAIRSGLNQIGIKALQVLDISVNVGEILQAGRDVTNGITEISNGNFISGATNLGFGLLSASNFINDFRGHKVPTSSGNSTSKNNITDGELQDSVRVLESISPDGTGTYKGFKFTLVEGLESTGVTYPDGSVEIRAGMSEEYTLHALDHEHVHVFFSPKGDGVISEFRQNLGQFGYDHSMSIRSFEEILAETNATGNIIHSVSFPFVNNYHVTVKGVAQEVVSYLTLVAASGKVGYDLIFHSSE